MANVPRRSLPLLSAATLLTLSMSTGASAAPPPRVDAAVQVTRTPSEVRGHAVPAVATHPRDDRIVAVGEADAYSSRCSVRVSTDAGLTWTATPVIPQDDAWPNCVYANFGPIVDVAFGPDGTLYYAYSGQDPATYRSRMFLARSSDLGRTFTTIRLPWVEPDLSKGQFGADALPTVVVDPNDADRIYVGWMSNNGTWNLSETVLEGKEYFWDVTSRPYVVASQDGGRTFSDPVDVAGDVAGWMSEPHLTVGADSEVFAFFGENVKAPKDAPEGTEAPPAHLYRAVSRDGGRSYTQQTLHTRPGKADSDWLSAPSPGVDVRTGDVYFVWEETAEGAPKVVFRRSSDGGETWSAPVQLNDAEPQREWSFNEFFSSLTVAPNGRIDVAWYDWRNDLTFKEGSEENAFQDVYLTYSEDHGRTWAPNIRVTDRAIDRRIGLWDTGDVQGPIGLASTDRAAYVAWDDTRNGNERTMTQDIYFARVRFASPDLVFAESTDVRQSRLLWGVVGAAAAFALGGLVLIVGTWWARRGPKERVPPPTAPGGDRRFS